MRRPLNLKKVLSLSLSAIVLIGASPIGAGQIVEESSSVDSGNNYSTLQQYQPPSNSNNKKAYSNSQSGYSEDNYSPAPKKSTKQAIKNSANETASSIIEETIRAVGDGIRQSLREGSNSNIPQQAVPETSSSESEGRRQKPRRW